MISLDQVTPLDVLKGEECLRSRDPGVESPLRLQNLLQPRRPSPSPTFSLGETLCPGAEVLRTEMPGMRDTKAFVEGWGRGPNVRGLYSRFAYGPV